MDEALAAIADAATGAAVARAVEPGAGEGHPAAQSRCLNCGTFLSGAHCHQCGQSAHIHRNVAAFGHDFLHSVLHFEGKAWRTLPMLAWRPGELTRRYIEGERAQFLSPLALFLFTVFLTFAVFNSVGFGDVNAQGPDGDTGVFDASSAAAAETEFRQASAQVERELAQTRAQVAAVRSQGKPTEALEQELREKEAAARILGLGNAMVSDPQRASFSFIGGIDTGIDFIDTGIARVNENPQLTLYKMQSNSYKYSWLLIPLSAPFLWLLYPFSRRFGWYDHLVFVTYSISFMALMWVVLRMLSLAGVPGSPLAGIGLLYGTFHMYRQLRGAYRSSRIGAVLRTFVLQMASFVTVLTFIFVLLSFEVSG
jgi:hypothetical protein